jgi:Holliday junction resolvase
VERYEVSKARQKGTSFETEVVRYLNENGFEDAERWGSGQMDLGDIRNVPIVLEAKNHKAMALSEWCDQAAASASKAKKLWAVVHKRSRKNTSQAYVTMSLENFALLLQAYEKGLTQK